MDPLEPCLWAEEIPLIGILFSRAGSDQHLQGITISCPVLLHTHHDPVKQDLPSHKPSPQLYNRTSLLVLLSLL